jgi:Lysozyme like domain/LysM domain
MPLWSSHNEFLTGRAALFMSKTQWRKVYPSGAYLGRFSPGRAPYGVGKGMTGNAIKGAATVLVTGLLVGIFGPVAPAHAEPVGHPVAVAEFSYRVQTEPKAEPKAVDFRYTIHTGDTLSEIAARYLGGASEWPLLWHANSWIRNPNLVMPGWVILVKAVRVTDPSRAEVAPVVATRLSGHLSYAGLEALWESAGGARWAAPTAACIAEHESGGNQYATGAAGERGYWQINPDHGSLSTYDAYGNARAAVIISADGRDWSPWTTHIYCGV